MVNLVPKYYINDPETEALLPSGAHLADGMRVLLQSSNLKVDIDRKLENWEMHRALQRNRWAVISDVKVSTEGGNEIVSFVATYDDGSQLKDTWSTSYAWYVKKDTFPSDDPQEEKREKVQLYLMATIMDTMQMMMSEGLTEDEKTTQLTEIVDKATAQILDVL
ncbi:hypothetical protein SEA_BING_76 [Streptomyces phage Bing]|uniref:Uncharacterized protein n=1 Tax=Streptomyces phage Bing TaxID=2079427 RepID=A0A2L1IWE7_9CAUD|nr:hypothetical protein FDJ31_gp76 [Streptomyces phage Bing]AVD99498.1 hypothetical protein SEA_BING_76 [Streptomyces phage Bing]